MGSETITLDEICTRVGIDLKNRTKILRRIKTYYSHGIYKLAEYGRAGKLKKAELIMLKVVADEFIRRTLQKTKNNKRANQDHGWLYLLKLKSLVRNKDGTYNRWVKIGECTEFVARLKQYNGPDEPEEVLCLVPVHNRVASHNSTIDFLISKNLVRARREYFQVPEQLLDEIVEGVFQNHHSFTGNYVLSP